MHSRFCGLVRAMGVVLAIVSGTFLPRTSQAGLSPENVIVVVNSASYESRTVANHYVHLRNIPPSNVVTLRDVPEGLTVPLEDFKNRILLPLLEQLNARKLAPQAKAIAYSAGFPTSVDISSHTQRLTDPNQKKYQLPTASLTGLTYYYQFMLADSEKYLDWGSNLYARGPFERHFANPFFDEERRARFDEAIAKRDAGDQDAAAAILEQLVEGSPTIAPMAILAAECRAESDDTEAAKRLIGQAIAAGWSSRRYLEASDVLSPLLGDSQLSRVKALLTDYPTIAQEPVAFESNVGWCGCGASTASMQDGVPYLMACMLAVVHPRGSTVEQAVRVLETAASSDSTFPEASFWFTFTRDDRTNPRFPQLGNALLWLKQAGHDAEIIHSSMPNAKTGQCVGLMLGVADISLDGQQWRFVPGALSENLTSLSAKFDTAAQTKITSLLHAGVAMSCGPVHEPYNLPFKFPSPMMYAYYASGVSAIESFYLATTCPYQQLIVGDPLAQPFARCPTDWVGVTVGDAQSGKRPIEFTRRSLRLQEQEVGAQRMEIFVEGKLVRGTPAVNRIEMSIPDRLTGAMEIRSVLIGGGPIRPRISHTEWLEVGDSKVPQVKWLAPEGVAEQDLAEQDLVELQCEGATSIELLHHGQSVGTIQGERGTVTVDRQALGGGPLQLRPVAVVEGHRIPGRLHVVTDDPGPP